MKTTTRLGVLMAVMLVGSDVLAEGVGNGSDMWTRTFEQWGLFQPHDDFCDSGTEVFVAVSGTANRGFCFEKDERTATTWEAARDDCATDKKRLPEPGEFRFACVNAGGLNNMTDDYEWASNFHTLIDTGGYAGASVIVMGDTGCSRATSKWFGYNQAGGLASSQPYRCVR